MVFSGAVSNTLVGNTRTIVTANGTLTVNQVTGEYSYQDTTPTLSVPASPGNTAQTIAQWQGQGIELFGFDGSNPYTGGVPANGLNLATLNATAVGKVRLRDNAGSNNDGLGVETAAGDSNNNRIENGESLVVDMNLSSKSATFTLTDLTATETAIWHAYDSSGVRVATGTILGNGTNIATGTITAASAFQYIVFTCTAGHFRLNGLNAVPEVPNQVFTYTLTDADGSNSSANLTIGTSGTNASPVAVADTGAVAEDATLTVSAVNGVIRGVGTDTDADNTTASLVVSGVVAGTGGVAQGVGVGTTVTGTYGTLTLNADGSYSYVADQAAADALATGVTGADVFRYTVADPSGEISNSTTLTISVTGTNDAPALDLDASSAGTGYAVTFTENGSGVTIVDTDVMVVDFDSANITGATITLTNPKAGDLFAVGSLPPGITAVVSGNIVTLSGSATPAAYQTALQAITFNNTADSPDTTPRSVTVTVTDGSLTSNTATATINVVAVNDAPVVDLDANNSTAAGTGFVTYFNTVTGAPVTVADADVSVTDVDSTNIASATITLTNAQAGDFLAVGSLPPGIASSIVGNVVTLTGPAFYTDFQTAIKAVSFDTSSLDLTARTISVTVNDGLNDSTPATTTINMVGANTPPVAVNLTPSGAEDTPISVTLSGTDPDGTVTGFVLGSLPANGALYLDAGLTIAVGFGSGDFEPIQRVHDDHRWIPA